MARTSDRGMVVAREAVVVTVGAVAPTYEQVQVTNRHTGERVTINKDQPSDPGSEGVSYTFRQYQRVLRSHPAVKTLPGAFISVDELSESEKEMVTG